MNSAQRRKLKRENKFTVTLHADSFKRFIDFDIASQEALRWCKKQCRGKWHLHDSWDESVFSFSLERDAVYFSLKWL